MVKIFFNKDIDIDMSLIINIRAVSYTHLQLSKGQIQRLILIRAILHTPKVLFLDAPTSGFAPTTALEIHKVVKELKTEGMAIFLTTHNMEEATKLCYHLALLNEGVIVEYGTPQDICLRYNKEKKYKILKNDKKEVLLIHTEENIKVLNQWLMDDEIISIHSCEPTLESVFLEVTGRELQ